MSGTKEHSGGKREGAGRPVISRTLRTGQRLLIHERDAAGNPALGDMATVEIVSRTKIILRHDNGEETIIGY